MPNPTITIGYEAPSLTATPQPLNVRGPAGTSVTVIWRPVSTAIDLTGVKITGPGGYSTLATTSGANNYQWIDPHRSLNVTYEYIVSAVVGNQNKTLDPQIINKGPA